MRVTKEAVYATFTLRLSAMVMYTARQTAQQAAKSTRREAELHQHIADLYAELAQADFDHSDDETARKMATDCLKMVDMQTEAHDTLVDQAAKLDRLTTFAPFWRRRPRAEP